MKILLIDSAIDGHHIAYLSEIVNAIETDKTIVLPEKVTNFDKEKIITYSPIDLQRKTLGSYMRWMKELSDIAKTEKPDIVHFLTGDNYYKYFGVGLEMFSSYKTIATFHWIRPGKIKHMSLKSCGKKVDKVIVHSAYLLKELNDIGLTNGVHIEYPQFKRLNNINQKDARTYWGINSDKKVILALGNTRVDKGLDILLEALSEVTEPFIVLIAGKPESFDQEYINIHTKKYSSSVYTALRYLTDEEVELAIAASDIIALPYRLSFNGASGPLGEGVCMNKCIIGSNHGNLGYTIQTNHLGYTFKSENIDSLSDVLSSALTTEFVLDDEYRDYQKLLDPKNFANKYLKIYQELLR